MIPPEHLLQAEVSLSRTRTILKITFAVFLSLSLSIHPLCELEAGLAGAGDEVLKNRTYTHFHRQFLCGQIRSDEVRTWGADGAFPRGVPLPPSSQNHHHHGEHIDMP